MGLIVAAAMAACAGSPAPATKPLLAANADGSAAGPRSAVQRQIAALLFRIPLADIDKQLVGASYDYNNFGDGAEGESTCTGYAGGHAGTDFQTQDVEGAATADREVFSLTDGEVLMTDTANGRVIVKTTMLLNGTREELKWGYLHLRSIAVQRDDKISRGSKLGVQGNRGMGLAATDTTTREHVHVEIRAGDAPLGAACGATPKDSLGNARFGALDPQPYFAAIAAGAGAR